MPRANTRMLAARQRGPPSSREQIEKERACVAAALSAHARLTHHQTHVGVSTLSTAATTFGVSVPDIATARTAVTSLSETKYTTFRSLGELVPGSACAHTSPIAKPNTNQDPTCMRRCCRFVSRPQMIVPGLNTSKLHKKFLSVGPTRRSVRARVTAT